MTTQLRAICPACFAQQATRNGRMVEHGYTRPQHWHSNVGSCCGVGHQHFGTLDGRDYTATLAMNLETRATLLVENAKQVETGDASVYRQVRIKNTRVYSEQAVDNPSNLERADYARKLRRDASNLRASAREYRTYVSAWEPAEPVAVEVEKKVTLLHLYGEHYRGKFCASSCMGAQKGYTTRDESKVTCTRCLERLAAFRARQAAKGAR